MKPGGVRILCFTAGRCGRVLAWLLPTSWLAAVLWATGADATATALQLPAAACVFACTLLAIVAWPLWTRDRPGADWLLRLRPGPLQGCGAAGLGALSAAAVGLLASGVCLPWLLVVPPARAHVALTAAGRVPVLHPDGPGCTVALPRGVALAELRLRPLPLLGDAPPSPTNLRVSLDGRDLGEPVAIAGEHLWRVPLPAAGAELRLQATGGTLALAFPPGSLEVVEAAPHPALANATLALLLQLVPGVVALAFACLLGPRLQLPVTLAGAGAVLLACTLGRLLPTGAALVAVQQGRWLPAEPGFGAHGLGLLLAFLLLLLALPLRRSRRP